MALEDVLEYRFGKGVIGPAAPVLLADSMPHPGFIDRFEEDVPWGGSVASCAVYIYIYTSWILPFESISNHCPCHNDSRLQGRQWLNLKRWCSWIVFKDWDMHFCTMVYMRWKIIFQKLLDWVSTLSVAWSFDIPISQFPGSMGLQLSYHDLVLRLELFWYHLRPHTFIYQWSRCEAWNLLRISRGQSLSLRVLSREWGNDP